MAKKRYPLEKRFKIALSETAYKKLRALNSKYAYGNNYLLSIVLENFDAITQEDAVDRVFSEFAAEYGAPTVGQMTKE